MNQVESAISKAKRRIIPILLIAYFAAFLDRVNVGFAALQMNQDLRLTATASGASAGAFFITYVTCEIPSNLLLARFGARIWIARIMVTWGAAIIRHSIRLEPEQPDCVANALGGCGSGILFWHAVLFNPMVPALTSCQNQFVGADSCADFDRYRSSRLGCDYDNHA